MSRITTEDFTILCEKNRMPLYYYILHKAVNHDIEPNLALDILQSTLLKAYAMKHTLRDSKKFLPWLFTIARNQAIRVIQKYNREELSGDVYQDYPDKIICSGNEIESIEEIIELKETRSYVTKMINVLSIKERDFIIQYYYHDLSYKEISSLTGVKEGALRVMHYRALKKLSNIAKELENE